MQVPFDAITWQHSVALSHFFLGLLLTGGLLVRIQPEEPIFAGSIPETWVGCARLMSGQALFALAPRLVVADRPLSRRFATSLVGALPKKRPYSRLNCDALR
jgi:hypothetical protein